jgi:pheromone shutdown protein TraB
MQVYAVVQYLVEQLRMLTGKVVAVVGLAHLDGIEERWNQFES